MLLHKFRHIDSDHGLLGIEQELGQRLAQLGFANPGRPQEQKRAVWTIGIRQTRAGTTHGIGNRRNGFFLTDHATMQRMLHFQQFLLVTLQHLGDGDPGPARHHIGDLFLRHAIAQQLHFHHFSLGRHIQRLLQVGDDAVLQFRHARQVTRPSGNFQVSPGLFQITLDGLGALHRSFLSLPDFLQIGILLLNPGNIVSQLFQTLSGCLIFFLFECLALDLQLDQTALKLVHFLRLGVNLHTD